MSDADRDRSARAGDAVHVLLSDGTTVRVRPVEPGDQDAVRCLYEEMSPENLRLRFFTLGRDSARKAADRLCAHVRPGARALLAESGSEVVGLAQYERIDGDHADVAVAVADRWHHRGVGTLLLEHLVSLARADGITAFDADALSENHDVLKVFTDLGLPVRRHFDGPDVHCVVGLAVDESYLSAVEGRARTADVASLEPMLRPRSVAVIGPGRHPGSVGRAVLRNIRARYAGRLYAVHPEASVILHVPTYHSVTALPQPPDLAVVAVPARAVPAVAEECGACGVRALLVLSSGLDAAQGRELLAACRRHGMRLVGPNCLGLTNTEDSVQLDATFAATPPRPGSAGVAVQSGGVGIALLAGLSRLGIGVSSFVSLGDKYDVSGNDMLQWWEGDGRTDLALLHLESFGNPRLFSRTARRVTRRIPVLTVDAGRTDAGRRAAASHTAAAASSTMMRQALFLQAGVTATRSIAELLETAALLHAQPLPAGRRVVVVSNAGGTGVLTADACAEAGLLVDALPQGLVERLRAVLPEGASAGNPVDTGAAVPEAELRDCLDLLVSDEEVEAVVVCLVPTAVGTATGEDLTRAVTDASVHASCPLAVVLPDQEASVRLLPAGSGAVPAYADPQASARALEHAARRAEWLGRPAGTVPALDRTDIRGAAAVVEAFLDRHPTGGWLSPRECAALLDCYAVPQLPWVWADNERDATAGAAPLSGPDGAVALKAHWPGLVHKSEEHAVRLGLRGEEQVRSAYREFVARFGDRLEGVLIQPMAERGVELFAGVTQDEVFGPVVLFGLGGTATEVLGDHAARLAPLTLEDVRELTEAPRFAPLLHGYRGAEPVDMEAVEQLLLRLSRMSADLPQLAEADLNPVVAGPTGAVVADVRVRLAPRTRHDPYLRRLR